VFASFSFDVIHITICFTVKAIADDGVLFMSKLLYLVTNLGLYAKNMQLA